MPERRPAGPDGLSVQMRALSVARCCEGFVHGDGDAGDLCSGHAGEMEEVGLHVVRGWEARGK